jgi:hypothetical protein
MRVVTKEFDRENNPQEIFVALCFYISNRLLDKEAKSLRTKLARLEKRRDKQKAALITSNPFYAPLAGQVTPQLSSKLNLLSFPQSQRVDPGPSTPLGSPPALLQTATKNNNKSDK